MLSSKLSYRCRQIRCIDGFSLNRCNVVVKIVVSMVSVKIVISLSSKSLYHCCQNRYIVFKIISFSSKLERHCSQSSIFYQSSINLQSCRSIFNLLLSIFYHLLKGNLVHIFLVQVKFQNFLKIALPPTLVEKVLSFMV